jgi:hypothetical protein
LVILSWEEALKYLKKAHFSGNDFAAIWSLAKDLVNTNAFRASRIFLIYSEAVEQFPGLLVDVRYVILVCDDHRVLQLLEHF